MSKEKIIGSLSFGDKTETILSPKIDYYIGDIGELEYAPKGTTAELAAARVVVEAFRELAKIDTVPEDVKIERWMMARTKLTAYDRAVGKGGVKT